MGDFGGVWETPEKHVIKGLGDITIPGRRTAWQRKLSV
jgi:hypothetical protein